MSALDRATAAAAAPIAYDVKGAAAAVGLSASEIYGALKANELTPVYRGTKKLVLHVDLLAWVNSFPLDKPIPK